MSFWYHGGFYAMMRGYVRLWEQDATGYELKVMLCTSSYVANRDHDFVSAGGANDPDDAELLGVSGYTRGWGGSGRKLLAYASKAFSSDDASDWAMFDYNANIQWDALGTGGTIAQALIIDEGASDDTDSRLVICLDGFSVATNGGNFIITPSDNGLGVIKSTSA